MCKLFCAQRKGRHIFFRYLKKILEIHTHARARIQSDLFHFYALHFSAPETDGTQTARDHRYYRARVRATRARVLGLYRGHAK